MGERRKKAIEGFESGYNCAQAVVAAFADKIAADPEEMRKIASSFGGGMGRLRMTCGAFSGAIMVLGALYGYSDDGEDGTKKELYARIQELHKRFTDKWGTVICGELLRELAGESGPEPSERTAGYYASRPCSHVIGDMADLLEEMIGDNDGSR